MPHRDLLVLLTKITVGDSIARTFIFRKIIYMPLKDCKRVLFKVSGEALMGSKKFGHDIDTLNGIAADIKEVCELGIQVCVVVGGGNIYRGADASLLGMDRASADYMGMLATVINALALQSSMERAGIYTRVQSAIPMTTICEPFIRRRAKRHMEKGRVVIFAAGIGSPFFTTDSAAVLRAVEMNCDVLFKGTNVDGVYSSDPKKDEAATRYTEITYTEVLKDSLKVKERVNFAKVLKYQGKYTLIMGK